MNLRAIGRLLHVGNLHPGGHRACRWRRRHRTPRRAAGPRNKPARGTPNSRGCSVSISCPARRSTTRKSGRPRRSIPPSSIANSPGEQLGYNSCRVFVQYIVWKADPQGLKKRFAQLLELADKHHLRVMPVLFDDCHSMPSGNRISAGRTIPSPARPTPAGFPAPA